MVDLIGFRHSCCRCCRCSPRNMAGAGWRWLDHGGLLRHAVLLLADLGAPFRPHRPTARAAGQYGGGRVVLRSCWRWAAACKDRSRSGRSSARALIAGVCGANITVAQGFYVADITGSCDRSRAHGLIRHGLRNGFIIGPAVGGVAMAWMASPASALAPRGDLCRQFFRKRHRSFSRKAGPRRPSTCATARTGSSGSVRCGSPPFAADPGVFLSMSAFACFETTLACSFATIF